MSKDSVFVKNSLCKYRLGMNNELSYINEINGLFFNEIDYNIQEFLLDIYENDICYFDRFFCFKYNNNGKPDIVIRRKRGNKLKYISIKMGHRNSVHTELLENFIVFLKDCGIEDNYLDMLREYHFKDGSKDGGGLFRLCSSEYQCKNGEKIRSVNDRLCETDLIIKLFDRFLFVGTGGSDCVDYIINGCPDNFSYIKREDVYVLGINHIKDFSRSVHFSFLTLQNKNANLGFKKGGERDRNYVQIRWYNMEDYIIESMNIGYNK